MILRGETETARVGARLAGYLAPGDVVLLQGEMGAGKSVLARAIARGLGVVDAMPSPTFVLMQPYAGLCKVYHFDLYRLEAADELYAAGLDEFIGGDGVALIEWPERCPEALPKRRLILRLAYGAEPDERVLQVAAEGGFPCVEVEG